jgi:glycosyltransferase involved in cell wall biosynthesis
MKIVFAIKSMDTSKGGAERVLADVTAGLKQRGHDVSVLTFDPPGGVSFYPLAPGIHRICLGIGDTRGKTSWPDAVKRMMTLRQNIQAEKPDIVIGFMHSMFVPLSFSLAGTGIPVIASEHIVPEHYRTRRFEFFLLLASSFFFKRMTVLSKKIGRSYPSILWPKTIVITNAVMRPENIPPRQETGRHIILTVGRLEPQKDQHILIRAFQTLAAEYPQWDVHIVGEGALKDELQSLIRSAGLEGRVFLKDTTPDIFSVYAHADIFALPSRYESFGLAAAEAMICGVPAVAFADCPGVNELIHDGQNGFLVIRKNDVVDFATALETLMKTPSLRRSMGDTARESMKIYDINTILDEWETLIRKTV